MHAYILTTIDTFTRVVLHRYTAYSIKKRRWEKSMGEMLLSIICNPIIV